MYSSRTRRMMLAIANKENKKSTIVNKNSNENGLGISVISDEIIDDHDVGDGPKISKRDGVVARPVKGKNISTM